MTLSELSGILVKILSADVAASATLPSMGTFAVEHTPSQIVNGGKTITPPSCSVVFDSSEVGYNGSATAVLNEYVAQKGISFKAAEEELLFLIKEIKHTLLDAAFVEFPGFGVVRFSEKSHFVFEPDPLFDPAAEYYGLEPLSLKVTNEMPEVIDVVELADTVVEEIDAEIVEEAAEETAEEKEINAVAVEETEKVAEEVEEKAAEEEKVEEAKKGMNRVVLALLVVVGIFVLLVVLLFLFKDELMPLLEKILYSKEELEILRKANL